MRKRPHNATGFLCLVLFLAFVYRKRVRLSSVRGLNLNGVVRFSSLTAIGGVSVLYLAWLYLWDYDAGQRSNRKSELIPRLIRPFVRWLKAKYFPAIVMRDFDGPLLTSFPGDHWQPGAASKKGSAVAVPRRRKYIVVFHPHGVLSMSTQLHFILSTVADSALPELEGRYRVVTISFNFKIPIVRDILLSLGLADASYASIDNLLRNEEVSVGIVLGGAKESLYATPGSNDVLLSRRIRFAQLALMNGASLVPVYSFNENMVFSPLFSVPKVVNDFLKSWFGFVIPFGFIPVPNRQPIYTIVGKAIHVPHIRNPTLADVLLIHNAYVKGLREMYDKYSYLNSDTGADSQKPSDLRIVDYVTSKDIKHWEKNLKRDSKL